MNMKSIILILTIIIVILSITVGFLVFKTEQKQVEIPEETAIQLAKTITIVRPSFASISEIDKYLKNTKLAGLGWAFKKAEETTGIGADFLVALSGQESGFGNNFWSNPPYNNPLSWGVTSKGAGAEAYFESKADCIIKVAGKLKSLYLTPGATYYRGQTVQSVAYYYCGGDDVTWYTGILNLMNSFQKTLPESSRAKLWAMETGIVKGNLPAPYFFTEDYWEKSITKEELSIYLYRINSTK